MAIDQDSDCTVCTYVSAHNLGSVLHLLQFEGVCLCIFVVHTHICMNTHVMCRCVVHIYTKDKLLAYAYKKDCSTYVCWHVYTALREP